MRMKKRQQFWRHGMEQKQRNTVTAPKVKICGITTMKEAFWLNAAGADYAGFVFYEKSKRNISITDAAMIRNSLHPSVKTVAVTVSPTVELLRAIEAAGFDILQVHKDLSPEVLRECKLPIWRAFNIADFSDVDTVERAKDTRNDRKADADAKEERLQTRADGFAAEQREREQPGDQLIEAYVLDGVEFGSGKTFDWNSGSADRIRELFGKKKLVLAGGLTPSNVAEGIEIFRPDIVDVSSGVEKDYGGGKDEEKIKQFISEVRKNG